MCQPGNWARSTNRPKPSTTCQPPQCRYKTCSTTPPSRLRPQPGARPRARATEGSIGGRSPLHTKDPGKPHTPTPEAPQHTGRTHSRIVWCGIPRHTKQASQPLHQSEATSRSLPHSARPRPPTGTQIQNTLTSCTQHHSGEYNLTHGRNNTTHGRRLLFVPEQVSFTIYYYSSVTFWPRLDSLAL
ncbi:hypothetical protein ATANTOWER_005649 [Ataeniobius toweri]|uniref:Uncharacterized protein n=1 Tax=Ataeniobius toweri TaxID=208326 RepID=A0ABU7BPJ3_9TELE|nr:hypothetical protein [Ataeniobius toweri]